MKVLIFLTAVTMGFAALPPLAQSTRELQALLADSQFYESLGSAERIESILRTETGYLVLTPHYAMQIDVEYGGEDRKNWVGPVPFQFRFYAPMPLQTEIGH